MICVCSTIVRILQHGLYNLLFLKLAFIPDPCGIASDKRKEDYQAEYPQPFDCTLLPCNNSLMNIERYTNLVIFHSSSLKNDNPAVYRYMVKSPSCGF